ncbi:MAG: metallophosphoesterase [Actinobacteria bacterium]|nr:metallophosphoesterase [Actinomycetota bacterium]
MMVIKRKLGYDLWPGIIFLAVLLAVLSMSAGCDNGVSGTNTTTAPTTAATSSTAVAQPLYIFAVCGDNRTMGIESGVLTRIVESAKSHGAIFMVNTGDVTGSGSSDELMVYRDFVEESGLEFHTVPGNHDVGSGGVSQDYEDIIGSYYFSFDHASDHFIILDNADDMTGIDGDQMRWLSSDLAANSGKRNQFIFTHIPIADPALPSDHVSGEKGGEGLRSGQELVETASAYPNMEAFFFGHIHAYLAYELGGIDAYVTGGAGAPLYFPESAGGYDHYLLVSVYPDSVKVEVVRV